MKYDKIAIWWAEIVGVLIGLCLFLQHHFNIDIYFKVILISGIFLLFYIVLTESKNKNEIRIKKLFKNKFKYKIKLLDRDKDILVMGVIAIISILITAFVYWDFKLIW